LARLNGEWGGERINLGAVSGERINLGAVSGGIVFEAQA
jgi:hypothetical protein